jgi:hypothetical protein
MINDKLIFKIGTPELKEMIEEYLIKCRQLANRKHLDL